jgi:hypothetical protein
MRAVEQLIKETMAQWPARMPVSKPLTLEALRQYAQSLANNQRGEGNAGVQGG